MTTVVIVFIALTVVCGAGAALFMSIVIESLYNEGE